MGEVTVCSVCNFKHSDYFGSSFLTPPNAGPQRANARLNGVGRIEVTRPIAAHEEIYWYYGEGYWNYWRKQAGLVRQEPGRRRQAPRACRGKPSALARSLARLPWIAGQLCAGGLNQPGNSYLMIIIRAPPHSSTTMLGHYSRHPSFHVP